MRVFRSLKHLLTSIKRSIGLVIGVFLPTVTLALSTHAHEDLNVPTVISMRVNILWITIVAWLRLQQTLQAATQRFPDIFDVRTVPKIITQITMHWVITTILLYAAVIPLYLTKPWLPAEDTIWLLTRLFIFIVPIYSTRLMLAWL